MGKEVKDKNRDSSGLQTERLEGSGKAFGRDGNSVFRVNLKKLRKLVKL